MDELCALAIADDFALKLTAIFTACARYICAGSEKVGVLFFQDKIGNPQGKDGPWKFGPVRQCCGRSYPECEGWKDGMPLDEGAKALLTGIDEHVNKAEQQGMFGKTPARESVKTNLEAAGWLDKLNVELGKQSFEAHFDQCQGPILTISIWRKGNTSQP